MAKAEHGGNRRDRPALVFDGDCGFCTKTALWVDRRARRPVDVVPWQYADLAALGLTEEETKKAAWWVETDGRRLRGHRAMARSFIACGGFWALLGWPILYPPLGWLAIPGYALIARFRGYLPGTTPACRRPDWPRSGRASEGGAG